jgi:hypothetical protein
MENEPTFNMLNHLNLPESQCLSNTARRPPREKIIALELHRLHQGMLRPLEGFHYTEHSRRTVPGRAQGQHRTGGYLLVPAPIHSAKKRAHRQISAAIVRDAIESHFFKLIDANETISWPDQVRYQVLSTVCTWLLYLVLIVL